MPDASRPLPAWLAGLDRLDFLFNGDKPPTEEQWASLDWSRAWCDRGPSPAGNPGPYWHVPWLMDDNGRSEELIARLYPKVLKTKWALLLRQACIEIETRALERG